MPISTRIRGAIQNSSWIRRMFEEGAELKAHLGGDQVFDFTLGNPDLEPPARFQAELVKAAADLRPGLHAYMPNAGLLQTRHALAQMLSRIHALEFKAQDLVLTCGASGGLNIILKALLDPGDEVVILAPYFPEYLFYADNQPDKGLGHLNFILPIRAGAIGLFVSLLAFGSGYVLNKALLVTGLLA